MALTEYKPGTTFPGVIGRTAEVSKPAWPEPNRAKEGAPNVLFIVLDDTGFGHLGCYGSPIETPNIDALAANGLRYSNMHTTALCSPSRSCIITGRNHHSNHLACLTNGSRGIQDPTATSHSKTDSSRKCFSRGAQHLLARQVAPGPGGDDDGGRPV
jgi:arylsulfatase